MGESRRTKSQSAAAFELEENKVMQRIRLESKAGELIAELDLPIFANGEPDAILYGARRVFIRRPMAQTEPPKKNNPETYFEASTYQTFAAGGAIPIENPEFDRVTETKAEPRKLRKG